MESTSFCEIKYASASKQTLIFIIPFTFQCTDCINIQRITNATIITMYAHTLNMLLYADCYTVGQAQNGTLHTLSICPLWGV